MPWSEEHVAQYEARTPVGTKARLALALYLNLGVRESDVVRIGPRHVQNGVLADFLPVKTTRTAMAGAFRQAGLVAPATKTCANCKSISRTPTASDRRWLAGRRRSYPRYGRVRSRSSHFHG